MDRIYYFLSKLDSLGYKIYEGDLPGEEELKDIIQSDETIRSIENIIPQVLIELNGKISLEGTLDNWRRPADRQTTYDEIMSLSYDNVTKPIEMMMLRSEINGVLAELKEREQDVLKRRYGLTGEAEMTLEEVGEIYGLTRERIRQIESKALRALMHPKKKQKLIDFYIDD